MRRKRPSISNRSLAISSKCAVQAGSKLLRLCCSSAHPPNFLPASSPPLPPSARRRRPPRSPHHARRLLLDVESRLQGPCSSSITARSRLRSEHRVHILLLRSYQSLAPRHRRASSHRPTRRHARQSGGQPPLHGRKSFSRLHLHVLIFIESTRGWPLQH